MNFRAAFAFLALSLAACTADATDDNASDSAEEQLKASKLSAEGQACGDDVAIQRRCAAGLTCVVPSSAPISEHTAGTCRKVIDVDGEWGADGAVMTANHGKASIEFGCGDASIDAFVSTGATSFAATGMQFPGSGVQFPPGMGPTPEPATFKGTVSGHTLKLTMTVDGHTSKMTFTKGRHIDLIRCL